MKAKVVEDADVVTYVVVCDPGDGAVAALAQFARMSSWGCRTGRRAEATSWRGWCSPRWRSW
jgi:hypothetical protein